jgi:hypothetical protein
MASAYTSITLTDGTTTLNLNDGSAYVLDADGWSPRVAVRRATVIGNQCPYENAVEEISISVLGSSPSNAISNLNTLINLVEQAARYANGDNVAAVTLQVEPQGVTAGQWKALVYSGEVDLPKNWADNLPTNEISGVSLRLMRRGLWYRSEYTSTTSSSTANQRVSAAMTITDPGKQGYLSEVLCTANADEGNSGTYRTHPGFLIVTNAANRVQYIASGSGSSSYADSSNKPASTASNVVTFTASTTIDLTTVSSPQLTTSAKRVAILGTFKTSDQSIPVICSVLSYDGSYERNYFTIPSYTAEDVQFCGVFNWNTNIRYVRFEVASGSPTIYFDMGVLVDVSDPSTSIVKINNITAYNHRLWRIVNGATDLTPRAESKANAGSYNNVSFQGDGWIPFNGTSVYMMRFARGQDNLWQPCTSTPTAITNTFAVKALEATLIPR